MMKKVLYLVIAIVVITGLTGCGQSRIISSPEKVTEVADLVELAQIDQDELLIEQNEPLCEWQLEFTEEMLNELPDVPDWNSEKAYDMYLEGYEPSEEILNIYKQKKRNDELFGGYLHIYYKGEKINYMPPYAEGMYAIAMYKQNGCLVTAHQTFDRTIEVNYLVGSEEIDLDIIPKEYDLLTTVNVYDGSEDKDLKEGFSICYDLENMEVVCIRFGEEIGRRVKISPKDIQEFMNREEAIQNHPLKSIGYINSKNELVYPTIVEDSTGIRFELLKKALKEQKKSEIYFSSAIVGDINFKVYDNKVYIMKNVKRVVNLDGDKGFCYGIWTTETPKIEEIPINYSELRDIQIELLSWYNRKEIEACASMGDMTIFGKDTYMYHGQFKNKKFQTYLFEVGFADIGVYADTLLTFEFDNWEEAKPIIIKLEEVISLSKESD